MPKDRNTPLDETRTSQFLDKLLGTTVGRAAAKEIESEVRRERQKHVDAIAMFKKRHETEVPALAARADAARDRLHQARDAFKQFLISLAPYSGAARLIAQAVPAAVGPINASKFPVRATGPTVPPWVAENGAIPIRSVDFDMVTIGPAKKWLTFCVGRVSWARDRTRRQSLRKCCAKT